MSQHDPNQPFVPQHNVVTNSPFNPNQPPAPKKHPVRNALLIIGGSVVGLIVLLGVIGAAAGGPDERASAPLPNTVVKTSVPPVAAPSKTTAPKPTAPAATQAPETTQVPETTQPAMTASQEQAVGSAESYLEFTAFSRKGLIRQLSSSAGEGFSVADATYAVDHVKVDWNEQAAKSAKSYLQMTNFSRQGLIHQLESSAGEGFTHSQAVYGVNKAGL